MGLRSESAKVSLLTESLRVGVIKSFTLKRALPFPRYGTSFVSQDSPSLCETQ